MRSEQEIRNKIKRLFDLEMEAVQNMQEAINDDCNHECMDFYMRKANAFQCQRMMLEWVLNETNHTKE